MGIASEYSKAKLAIVDPVLTYGLPKSLTGSTAMDAFAHGYEAFTGLMHNPVSDLYAEKTMRLVVDNLPLVMADPGNTEARDALMLAATIGGMSFGDSMVHLGHNIGQNIGTLAHTPHGVSCMLGVLAAIEYLAPAVPEKTAFVGALFGLDPLVARSHEALGRETAARYKAFLVSCGLPATLRELGVQESVLEPAAKLIEEDFILQPCAPRKPDAAEALALLKKIF
jgi:alcohol dehydrogenase class IV